VAAHSDLPEHRHTLGITDTEMGACLFDAGRLDAALVAAERGRGVLEALVAEHPRVPEYRRNLANSHNTIGVVHVSRGRLDQALLALEQARVIRLRLANDSPALLHYQLDLAESIFNVGSLKARQRHLSEALELYEQARAKLGKLAEYDPSMRQFAALWRPSTMASPASVRWWDRDMKPWRRPNAPAPCWNQYRASSPTTSMSLLSRTLWPPSSRAQSRSRPPARIGFGARRALIRPSRCSGAKSNAGTANVPRWKLIPAGNRSGIMPISKCCSATSPSQPPILSRNEFSEQERLAYTARHAVVPPGRGQINQFRSSDRHGKSPVGLLRHTVRNAR
jgi:tetratricopeptide (TPR) repeat protein